MSDVKSLIKAFHAEKQSPNRNVASFKILDDRSYIRDELTGQYKMVKAQHVESRDISYFFGYAENVNATSNSYDVIRNGIVIDNTYARTFF